MAIATSTVTLNAAFLQEIKEDNRELSQLLCNLRFVFLGEGWLNMPARKLHDKLAELRDQLAMHFALEEAFGYFDDPLHAAPWLCEQADALRAQHGRLYLDLCDLVEMADCCQRGELPGTALRELAQRFQEFDVELQTHEAAEDELILAAFDDDIGVGD